MGFREVIVQHGSTTVSRLVADGIRSRGAPPRTEPAPQPARPALDEAERLVEQHRLQQQAEKAGEDGPRQLPAQLFGGIEGHEAIIDTLERAARSARPTHVLLVGPPGGGKTELLLRLRRLPGATYATGASISTAGLAEFLRANPKTQILLVDDIDKADPEDLWGLLQLMQTGSLTQLKAGRSETIQRKLRVFAAANQLELLPEPLRSRFVVQEIPAYTLEQFHAACTRALTREGIPPARARAIAQAVGARSRDPRDAVKVAHLLGPDEPIQPIVDRVVPGKVSR
jgi:Holliday junction resolvasome RuvABC ATP-dependent DNA helicase subunit